MPVDDNELYGRIRDYIALIGQGAESKIQALQTELYVHSQRESLIDFITELGQTVKRIDGVNIEQQNLNEHILSDLVDEIEESFFTLEMTEKQETTLRNIIQKADDKTKSLHDNGLTIENEFDVVLESIQSMVKQSGTQFEEMKVEEADTFEESDVFEDDDVLLF